MKEVFLTMAFISGVYAIFHYIKMVIAKTTKKSIEIHSPVKRVIYRVYRFLYSLVDSLLDVVRLLTDKRFLGFISLTVGILLFFSILPYVSNLNDEASIQESRSNIELFNEYSTRYAEAAQQQINDYSEMQQEMARRATLEQLSFWSEQQDLIGDRLTEQLRDYQIKIEEEELEINRLESRIQSRLNNKWYFYLDE